MSSFLIKMPGSVRVRGGGSVRQRVVRALRAIRRTYRRPLRGTRLGNASREIWAASLPSRRKLSAMGAVTSMLRRRGWLYRRRR